METPTAFYFFRQALFGTSVLKPQAVETDALWKPWKNQRTKAIFPPFPQRLENSPQKTLRVSHSSHSFGG